MRATQALAGLSLALFAAAMLLWLIPAEVPSGFAGQLSPRLLPQITMWGVLLLGLWIAGVALLGSGIPVHQPGPFVRSELVVLVAVPALVLVAWWVLTLVGPLVAGAVLVVGAALMMGERNPLTLVLLPVGALGTGWLLLYRILGTTVG